MDNTKDFNLTGMIDKELATDEDIKDWLTLSLEEYLKDGDLNSFVQTLEDAVRAKDNIASLSRKTGISRSNLYAIFKGEATPQFDTVMKIFKELRYSIKVA